MVPRLYIFYRRLHGQRLNFLIYPRGKMNDKEKDRLIELDNKLEDDLLTFEESVEYIALITNKNFKEHDLLRQ